MSERLSSLPRLTQDPSPLRRPRINTTSTRTRKQHQIRPLRTILTRLSRRPLVLPHGNPKPRPPTITLPPRPLTTRTPLRLLKNTLRSSTPHSSTPHSSTLRSSNTLHSSSTLHSSTPLSNMLPPLPTKCTQRLLPTRPPLQRSRPSLDLCSSSAASIKAKQARSRVLLPSRAQASSLQSHRA